MPSTLAADNLLKSSREIRRLEKELIAMRKRVADLDAIFKRPYEDSVLGNITTEQFQNLSCSYTEEHLKRAILEHEAAIKRLRDTLFNTDSFIAKAKRYTDIGCVGSDLAEIEEPRRELPKQSLPGFQAAV